MPLAKRVLVFPSQAHKQWIAVRPVLLWRSIVCENPRDIRKHACFDLFGMRRECNSSFNEHFAHSAQREFPPFSQGQRQRMSIKRMLLGKALSVRTEIEDIVQ